jgi:molybdopterin molybdotransferase
MTSAPAVPAPPINEQRMLSVEEALAMLLDGVETLPAEMAPLLEAAGRVLGADVYADTALPPWDNSAMDGFAVRAADLARATADAPAHLRVDGEVAAGRVADRAVGLGGAMRIMTGAPLPEGADAVIPIEDTSAWHGPRAVVGAPLPDAVDVYRSLEPGAHVRSRGGDVEEGARILHMGDRMTPGAIALAAAVGRDRVSVVRRPRLGLLATGDEIVAPGKPAGPGRIHDANTAGLAVLGKAAGAQMRSFGVAPDELAAVEAALDEALGWADVVVVTGGVSVGARDVVKDAFERIGSVAFWRVAVQPGKPLVFARAQRRPGAAAGGPVLLFGLPGNPVSSYVTFELFVRPALRKLAGSSPHERRLRRARLAERATKSPERRAFLRVRLEEPARPGDLPIARLSGDQGSHVLSALAAADGLAVVPEGRPSVEAGEEVDVWLLDGEA